MKTSNSLKHSSAGMKMTPQRMAILEFLDGNLDHPSADDVYRAVSARYPNMSCATVYNTLETLRKRGGLLELSIDPLRKRFDPNPKPHNHLICTACRKIVDVHIDYHVELPAETAVDFEITGNHIEFYGVCPECKQKTAAGNRPEADG